MAQETKANPGGGIIFLLIIIVGGIFFIRAIIHAGGGSSTSDRGSGTPSCTIQASDPSDTYTGVDVVDRTSPLQPGGVWSFDDDLTITHQGAQYVTNTQISCQ